MARKTYSRNNSTRKINEFRASQRLRNDRIRKALIKYLNGGSPSDVINEMGYENEVVVDYEGKRIMFERYSHKIIPINKKFEDLESKLNYLHNNMPPIPKSFEDMYHEYILTDDKKQKINLVRNFFDQLPENVDYYIPINASSSINIWKEGKDIYYRYTRNRELGRYFEKNNLIEILEYANAIKNKYHTDKK